MGTAEGSSTAKHPKPTLTQETHPPPYVDWSTSMQAYYGGGATPPFFASASPTPHPYIWGGQHPMMPPYGTPVPYPTLYSPPAVYPHPGIPMTPNNTQPIAVMEPKAREENERAPKKNYKGILGNGNVVGVSSEGGKVASSSGNDGTTTPSVDSENNGSSDANLQNDDSGNQIVSMPATVSNLSMGIDLWNPSPGNVSVEMQPNPSGATQAVVPLPIMGQWARQDEREMKRQKRKQSNRESARRSRMRKQAECEELQAKVEVLSNENHKLKDELQRLSEECKKLTSENDSIKGKLSEFCEPEAESKLDAHLESRENKGKY